MFSTPVLVLGFSLIFICYDVGKCAKNVSDNDLVHHNEVHIAKNLIDALSMKLHLSMEKHQSKYSSSKLQTLEYLNEVETTQRQLDLVHQLKNLFNKLSSKPTTTCENVYFDYDFTASRPIIIRTGNSSLPKNYTVKLQVNHRLFIDSGLALDNGNDLRVFYKNSGETKAKEIDRILQNMGTTKATVLFKLQEEVRGNFVEKSKYILAYGKKIVGQPKENAENVYLFYDDFSDGDLEKKWQRNWGTSNVINGKLEVKTDTTPTGNNAEVAVFVKDGGQWKDVEIELAMMESTFRSYPGPFLRLEDPRIQATSGWWLEYFVDAQLHCTMRPIQRNKDGGWLYKETLSKLMEVGKWYNTKYRVVGDRFSHWINDQLIHDNIKVSSAWMISKGTLGLGCHQTTSGHPIGCHTYYDNIKVTNYVSSPPTLSLGKECKVDLTLSHGLGTSENNPATSCKQIHDISLHDGQHRLRNGVYWIKTAADRSVQTYCDLVNGGWTLIGKISGKVGNIHKTWLVSNHDVKHLSSPELPSSKQVSCIDARYLATYHASTVMFASGENRKGFGSKWVQWSLPEERESETLWTHSVGYKTVSKAPMKLVIVKASNGGKKMCYQNKFGIMPLAQHGGSYPSVSHNTKGNTEPNDNCMAIGVQSRKTQADGWIQNANGYDSPRSNTDWPNSEYDHGSPYVTVWLK